MIRCDWYNKGCGCVSNSFIWVNDDEKKLWYEIPKNASSSIKSELEKLGYVNVDKYKDSYSNYFKYCVVRNPWDRMVSNWRMFCYSDSKGDRLNHLFKIKNREISLEDFIKLSVVYREHHWEHQNRFIKSDVDKIFKLEEFDGVELGLDLPTINPTNRDKNYKTYYNNNTIKMVQQEYKTDIEMFGYFF